MQLELIPPHIRQIAAELGFSNLSSAALIRTGGNNQIWRLESALAKSILKLYPKQSADTHNRLATEWAALSFLAYHRIDSIPKPLARTEQAALYEFIPGDTVQTATPHDITEMADFFLSLQALRSQGQHLSPASAACISTFDALQQLRRRLQNLIHATPKQQALQDFLQGQLYPLAEKLYRTKPYPALAKTQLALNPSDFGLHNAIRRPDGRLAFVDFEYFGWDDPVKATADVTWHAGMELAEPLARQFQRQMIDFFSETDREFAQRLQDMLPIYGLIWCLIMLNEFLPEVWERRCLSGRVVNCEDADDIRDRQLTRARILLEKLCLLC